MSQIDTSTQRFEEEEEASVHYEVEVPNWDTVKCERHPQFKVTAISIDEDYYDDDTKLLCLKCILEENYLNSTNSKKILKIREFAERCSESLKNIPTHNNRPKDNLDEEFLDFLAEDYIGVYERHIETQYPIVDHQINNVIDNLMKLKNKYKDIYAEELVSIRVKAEDIKKKIRNYLDESSEQENSNQSSLQQLLQRYHSVRTADELSKVLKEMHRKSKETTQNATSNKDCHIQTLQIMKEFKAKASNLETKEADLYYLQEMDHKVRILLRSSDSMLFKKSNGTSALTNSFKLPEPPIKLENTFSNIKFISPLEDQSMSLSIFSDNKTSETFLNAKRNRPRSFDIESQSLRNLLKEFEEKENSDPNSTTPIDKKKAAKALHDWINRRITGYLIFQNTLNNDPEGIRDKEHSTELGVHQNHMIGQKWKTLTKEEKDKYKSLAVEFRKRFRGTIDELETTGNLNELIESLDTQIKKIKRE